MLVCSLLCLCVYANGVCKRERLYAGISEYVLDWENVVGERERESVHVFRKRESLIEKNLFVEGKSVCKGFFCVFVCLRERDRQKERDKNKDSKGV